jgi:hypothetical protein
LRTSSAAASVGKAITTRSLIAAVLLAKSIH